MLKSFIKKNIYQKILAVILILSLAIALVPGAAVRASANTYDVSNYKGDKNPENWTYPKQDGKVFAGWYTDDTYSTAYTATTGNAVARFVDAKVLNVKKQLLPSEDGLTVNVRFLTAVDSGKFSKVIFRVEAGDTGRSFTLEETTAYRSVLVDSVAEPKTAADVFGTEEAQYFVLHSITGIPRSVFDEVFTATPYWITQDGTKVQGTTADFTINDAIWANTKYMFEDNSDKLVVQKLNGGSFVLVEGALKVTTVHSSSVAGAQILFDNIDVSKYQTITIKYKSSDTAGIYVNGDKNLCLVWGGTNGAYTTVDFVAWANSKGVTHLKSLDVGLITNGGKTTYIDEIILTPKAEYIDYSKANYQFASYHDLGVTQSYNNGKFSLKKDPLAEDGWSLWSSTSGATVLFNNLDVSKYESITVKWRSTGSNGWANLMVNGTYWSATSQVDAYNELELIGHAASKGYTFTTLTSLNFYNSNSCETYIDSITFVEKEALDYSKIKYTFAESYDLKAVQSYNGGTFSIVDDSAANDGKALKGTAPANGDQRGIKINFDKLNINQYESIIVRWKTAGSWANVYINGDYNTLVTSSNSKEYVELDLVKLIAEKNLGVTELSSLDFVKNEWNYPVVYVDEIIIVKKDSLGTPYAFNKEADLRVVSAYHSGTFSLADDSAANDGKALKVTTGTDFSNVSGAQISLGSLNVSEYETIKIRLRSTDIIDVYLNGTTSIIWQKYDTYTEIDLKEYATTKGLSTLTSVEVGRKSKGSINVYVDEIIIVTQDNTDTPYDFNEDADLSVVSAYNGGTFSIVDDSAANDGKALKGTAPANGDQRGIKINFDKLNINQYESIIVRWKTAGSWANVYINGDYNTLVTSSNSKEYVELDLVKLIAEKNLGVTELSYLDFVKNEWNYPVVYVDQITFVLKFPTYATLSDPQNEGLELAFFGAPSLATKDAFQQLKNTGAKTVYLNAWAGYSLESDKLKTALEICDELGLNAYYHVNRNGFDSSSWDTDAANIITTATDYTQFPAFKGFYAWDEPNIDNMKELIQTELQEWNASKYKDKHYLVNLCGTTTKTNWWGSETQVDTTTVLTNSWNYVLKDNPNKVLLYDRYPFRVSGSDANNLFMSNKVLKEIEEFASFAKDKRDAGYDVKLHTFIQTFGDNPNPEAEQLNRSLSSVREVRFNCAYNMVYGAKGLVAFTYERQSQFPTGMIEPSGVKNDSYYYVKKVFNELRQWEHVYSAFDWKGTITLDGTATGAGVQDASHITQLTNSLNVDDVERISAIETQHDLLVGTFKDNNGYDGYMVTSYVDPYYKNANNVKIKFNQASKALVYYNGTLLTNDDADTAYLLEDGVFNMTLDEGDYVFIIPVK